MAEGFARRYGMPALVQNLWAATQAAKQAQRLVTWKMTTASLRPVKPAQFPLLHQVLLHSLGWSFLPICMSLAPVTASCLAGDVGVHAICRQDAHGVAHSANHALDSHTSLQMSAVPLSS